MPGKGKGKQRSGKGETQHDKFIEKSNPPDEVTNLDLGKLMSFLFEKFEKTIIQIMITVKSSTQDSFITIKSEFKATLELEVNKGQGEQY